MSDEIDWIPVALWSAGVFGQIDAAIRSWWMNRGIREEQRRLNDSDWSKIQRGETKRGFRLWLERQCCPQKSILEEDSHFPVPSLLPNDYDWDEWIKRELTSIFMAINHPMPNSGRFVLNLRRYSFFEPKLYTDIAQMIYSTTGEWFSMVEFQLGDRTIASAFKNRSSGRICVIFIDIKQRSYRLLNVPPILPFNEGSIEMLYVGRGDGTRPNRLRIVVDNSRWDQHEIISVDYEIRPSKKNPCRLFAVEVGRQSIVIPGSRVGFAPSTPGTYILKANEQNQSSFVITIDQRGDFQLHHYDEWKNAIMATDIEQRSRKAEDDFGAMLPEQLRDKYGAYRYSKHILGYIGDSFVKRQIYPPSMMHVAAEAICQSKPPNADLFMIKSETGIDIFDGIIEDREKPVPTIYLPSNAELMQDE